MTRPLSFASRTSGNMTVSGTDLSRLIVWIASRTMRTTRCAAALGLVFLAASVDAQTTVKHVLVLQSFTRGNIVLDTFTGYFRVELDRRAGTPMNVIQVTV